jgi:signal transduction histidine kinase
MGTSSARLARVAADLQDVQDRVTRLQLFAGLSDDLLRTHVLVGEEVRLSRGEVLIRQGELSLGFDILLEGAMEFASQAGGQRVHVITVEPPGFWGHEPLMADVPVPVTGVALADTWVYRLVPDRFWAMVGACPGILRRLVRTVAERFQTLGENTEQQMRLVSLGTMAAGLAHELNNPAAAARSAASDLQAATRRQAQASIGLTGLDLPASARAALERLVARDAVPLPAGEGALARADRADELVSWLEREDVDDAEELGTALADAGVTQDELAAVLDAAPPAARAAIAAWLAWTRTSTALAADVGEATGRLSELIAAMRNYSRLDQAPEQDVDLRQGLEDTLTVMRPKLRRGIVVERDYDDAVPAVIGSAGQLDQVWTNLIDNAIVPWPAAASCGSRPRAATTAPS